MSDTPRARLLIVDVDGTLLTNDHQITPATRAAMRNVVERGVQVVLASARSPQSLQRILGDLGIEGFVISYTGALMCMLSLDPGVRATVIAEHRIDLVTARMVVASVREQGIGVRWFAGERCYLSEWNAAWRQECRITGDQPIVMPDLTTVSETPHKLLCIAGESAMLPSLKAVAATLPTACVGQFSHTTYLEITRSGVDKAAAALALGQRLGIAPTAMVAIGDQENDQGMLHVAALGIAMGNAPPAVQATADWITETNSRNGVALAIEWLQATDWI